jgi:hypothetical protein
MYNTDTYRVILSFDTSGLPDGATITGATLRIYRSAYQGNVTSIQVDIRNGFFGTASTLTQTDFNATASATGIALLTVPSANNTSSQVNLPSVSFAHISKTGKTQFRLKGVSAADSPSDLLTIYGGENTTYAPVLIITYNP